MIANMRFNGYSREAVLAPAVRARFAERLRSMAASSISPSASIASVPQTRPVPGLFLAYLI